MAVKTRFTAVGVANPVYLRSAWQTPKSWYTAISSEVGRGYLISKKNGRFAGHCSTPAGVALRMFSCKPRVSPRFINIEALQASTARRSSIIG
jgi:hypothetical protein